MVLRKVKHVNMQSYKDGPLQNIFRELVSINMRITALLTPRSVEASIDWRRRLRALETARVMVISAWRKHAAGVAPTEDTPPPAQTNSPLMLKLARSIERAWGGLSKSYKEYVVRDGRTVAELSEAEWKEVIADDMLNNFEHHGDARDAMKEVLMSALQLSKVHSAEARVAYRR